MLKRKLTNNNNNNSNKETKILDLSYQNCPAGDYSKYFPHIPQTQHQESVSELTKKILEIQRKLSNELNQTNFHEHPRINFIYNPTEYAKIPFEMYFIKYCQNTKPLLFVGMNPGPFGMCQTGVPFGDTNRVKNWLKIEGPVEKPLVECPTKPIYGFNCPRTEQSGDRLWQFFSDHCNSAEKFFENSLVYNYCPIAFLNEKGVNITPADLKNSIQLQTLEAICDKYYIEAIKLLQPEIIVVIGRYVETRTKLALNKANLTIPIIYMPHPSPRVPNNENWHLKATIVLEKNNLSKYFHNE